MGKVFMQLFVLSIIVSKLKQLEALFVFLKVTVTAIFS